MRRALLGNYEPRELSKPLIYSHSEASVLSGEQSCGAELLICEAFTNSRQCRG